MDHYFAEIVVVNNLLLRENDIPLQVHLVLQLVEVVAFEELRLLASHFGLIFDVREELGVPHVTLFNDF